jgi:hypothetical protein
MKGTSSYCKNLFSAALEKIYIFCIFLLHKITWYVIIILNKFCSKIILKLFKKISYIGGKKMKAIINGKIILKDRVVEDGVLLYSDVIEGVVKADQIPEGAEIIDANGGYVAPGLIELHIHGYLGKDVCDGEEESLRDIAEGIVQNGVTAFLPTTMTESMDTIKKSLESIRGCMEKSKTWKGSVILGAHAEGPFISPSKKGAQALEYILKPDAKFVKESTAAGFVNLKGHRTVGGMRASIYNAMPVEGVEKLIEFMDKFEKENS